LAPGLTRRPLKGVDSEVGRWAGPSGEIVYDFGAFSNTLGDPVATAGTVCRVTIGGRAARVVVFRDERGRYAFGAHWSGFPNTGLGPSSLTIKGYARDSIARDSLLTSAWTVAFRHR
jgi:hypothetical protein